MADHVSDGGPAFPQEIETRQEGRDGTRIRGGMSLRDYFAAKAMQGLVERLRPPTEHGTPVSMEMVSADAYAMADAMLTERAKESRR